MALSIVNNNRGSWQNSASTSATLNPNANLGAGNYGVLMVACDNPNAIANNGNISCSDNVYGAWTRLQEREFVGAGAAKTGVDCAIFLSPKLTSGLATTDTITVTWTGNQSCDNVGGLIEISAASSKKPAQSGSGGSQGVNGTSYSVTLSSLNSVAGIYIGVASAENEVATAVTLDALYTAFGFGTLISSTAGNADANICMSAGSLSNTSTGDTFDNSGLTTSDRATLLVRLEEVPDPQNYSVSQNEIVKLKDGAPSTSKNTIIIVYELTNLSETKTITFTPGGGSNFSKSAAEIVKIAENISKNFKHTSIDNLLLREYVLKSLSHNVNERTLLIEKPLSLSVQYTITENEILKLLESRSRGAAYGISPLDIVKLGEFKQILFAVTNREIVKLSETKNIAGLYSKTFFEVVKLLDVFTADSGKRISVSDQIILSEYKSLIINYGFSIVEKLILKEAITFARNLNSNNLEIVKLRDSINRALSILDKEVIILSDAINRATAKVMSEKIFLSESLTKYIGYSKTSVDTIKLIETLNKYLVLSRTLNETIKLKERLTVNLFVPGRITEQDAVLISELLIIAHSTNFNPMDTVLVSDSINRKFSKTFDEKAILCDINSLSKNISVGINNRFLLKEMSSISTGSNTITASDIFLLTEKITKIFSGDVSVLKCTIEEINKLSCDIVEV